MQTLMVAHPAKPPGPTQNPVSDPSAGESRTIIVGSVRPHVNSGRVRSVRAARHHPYYVRVFFSLALVQQNNFPSFRWRHLLRISVLLFKQSLVLSSMNLVSCKHRLHVVPFVADGLTFFKIDHCIVHSLSSSANFQTYLDSSVAFLPEGFLKDALWLRYRSLNSVDANPT